MNDFESILARIRNEPPPHVRDAVRAVMGAASTWRPLDPKEFTEKVLDGRFGSLYNDPTEAIKAMREASKPARSARSRRLNKALRAADIDPAHFQRMVRNNHTLAPEAFVAMIDSYRAESADVWIDEKGHETSNRNEWSKQTHSG